LRGTGTSHSKKNEIKPWQRKGWVIPPEQNGSFVAFIIIHKYFLFTPQKSISYHTLPLVGLTPAQIDTRYRDVIDLLRDSEHRQTTSLLLARDRLAKNNHFDAQPASQGNAS
jgi:hypothetical protein